MRLLQVNEIFGPTLQGEGPWSGHHCLFVRLYGCNQECTWCDTDYTWAVTPQKAAKTQSGKQWNKSEQCHEMSADKVIEELRKLWDIDRKPTIIVISGGEPMMQQTALCNLFEPLIGLGCAIHIETAGTIMPTPELRYKVWQFVVSPKLANSGNPPSKRYRPKVLRALRDEGAYFKFVVSHLNDFEEIDQIVKDCAISTGRVMIMPEGTTLASQRDGSRYLADETLKRGYGLTIRQHILIWGNERARL